MELLLDGQVDRVEGVLAGLNVLPSKRVLLAEEALVVLFENRVDGGPGVGEPFILVQEVLADLHEPLRLIHPEL